MTSKVRVAWLLSAVACSAFGSVEFGAPFSDNMVLQRDKNVAVWGRAEPNGRVTVAFSGQRVEAAADGEGRWRIRLQPMPASFEGKSLEVSASLADGSVSRQTFTNVVVGEVWLAGGQSNMNFPIDWSSPRHCEEKGAMVAQYKRRPYVRFANVPAAVSTKPQKDGSRLTWKDICWKNVKNGWQRDGYVRRGCSAVVYYYAIELFDELQVPIGVMHASSGGTNIEQWTPREGYLRVKGLEDYAEKYPVEDSEWNDSLCRGAITRPSRQPGMLWNGYLERMTPFTFRGVIWYQGCSNESDWKNYTRLSHALYRGWSERFENPGMPFFFVQLCPHRSSVIPQIQTAQTRFAEEEPNAAIVIANDLGNLSDIHPNRKQLVAQRLALHAFKRVYGYADIQNNSPTVESATVAGKTVSLVFRDAQRMYVYNDDRSLDANFELAGEDGKWHKAEIVNFVESKGKAGKISRNGLLPGNRVELVAEGVEAPKKVRHLYREPWKGALYSEFNLPVGVFERELAPGQPEK